MKTIDAGFLGVPATTGEVQRLYDASTAQQGFLMNATRLWAHQPALYHGLFDLIVLLAGLGQETRLGGGSGAGRRGPAR